MHAAPAVSFLADDGGLWRAAVAGAVATTAAALAAWLHGWLAAWHDAVPASGATASALLAAAAAGAWGWRRGRRTPVRLSWDTRTWLWQAAGGVPLRGRLQAAIDLGGWMLLTFTPETGRRPAWPVPVRWIPVGARAVATARAALYATGAGPARGTA